MVAVYVPEIGEENCEILMVEKDWFKDGIQLLNLDQVYVTWDEYIAELQHMEQIASDLDNTNWDMARDIEELQRKISELEEERDDLQLKVESLEDNIRELEEMHNE
jgi:peptidoglycan hydrolase CwlO-like protein